jgi:hypothetical protein
MGWREHWDGLRGWQPYDPQWLVALARAQYPDEPWLAEALAQCRRALGGGTADVHFVDPARPNQPGSAWQFDRTVELDDPETGLVVLDVLEDGRIGGLEMAGLLTR